MSAQRRLRGEVAFSNFFLKIYDNNVFYHQFVSYHQFMQETPQFDLIGVMNGDVNYHVSEKSE